VSLETLPCEFQVIWRCRKLQAPAAVDIISMLSANILLSIDKRDNRYIQNNLCCNIGWAYWSTKYLSHQTLRPGRRTIKTTGNVQFHVRAEFRDGPLHCL